MAERQRESRFVPGVGLVQADEHWDALEEIAGDAEKCKAVIKAMHETALRVTVDIKENPSKAIVKMDHVIKGIELLMRLFGVS